MSLDGYVAGPDQGEQHPLGVGGEDLHRWMFPLKAFKEGHGGEGGEVNASSAVVEDRRAGERLFEGLEPGALSLDQIRAIDAPGVAHIKYSVRPARR